MGVRLHISGAGSKGMLHDLERLRMNGSNAKPAMARIAQVMVDANRDQFKTQGQHYGSRWAPLSPGYKLAKQKTRPGRPILQYNYRLLKHAAPVLAPNAGVYQVNGKRAEVGLTYQQVPYAQHHQEGTATMPARPIMGQPTREDQKKMTKELHTWLMSGLEVLR